MLEKDNLKNLKLGYFGGEPISVPVLEELKVAGILPSLIVTNPDRPVGRKQTLTPPPTKVWALEHNIKVFQPESVSTESGVGPLTQHEWDLFVVVGYGLIMPKWLIDLPKYKTLNMHPSLLPRLRGPSPIRTAILKDQRETGVTVIQLDEKMDHGPIVAQQPINIAKESWPLPGRELDEGLARLGGSLLAATIPKWLAGEIEETEQVHEQATFTKKIQKADSELKLDPHNLPTGDEAYQTYLKICAYDGWPGTFFIHEGKRIKISKAELSPEGQLRLLRIIPEGKKEMEFSQWNN